MQHIHLLPPQVANQIAAGEVVERPASAVKELVENSLDAGATRIHIRIEKAGKQCIDIDDDGCGMSAADALMALQRHATSKINNADDLHAIASHGFRGEALPSVASVSRFRLHTACKGEEVGTEVRVNQLGETESMPAAWRQGTRIEVRDLFLNTPARLRFMRADKTEEAAIIEVVRGLALAHAGCALRLDFDGRNRLDLPACTRSQRITAIMGEPFMDNVVPRQLEHDGIIVDGYLGLPTYHHRDATRMLFLVNGRVIRDKQLIAALRAAYRDVMFHDRYPVAVVYIEMDPADVDVNVHPAKREVRFKAPQSVRAAVVACVRAALASHGQQVAPATSTQAVQSFANTTAVHQRETSQPSRPMSANTTHLPRLSSSAAHRPSSAPTLAFKPSSVETREGQHVKPYDEAEPALRLGTPLAQLHHRYILTQTAEGVILVDQHAAHERINYERMKREMADGRLLSQRLLLPVAWQPDAHTAAWLHDHSDGLQAFAVEVKACSDDAFTIHAVPALLQDDSPLNLVEELVAACQLIGCEAEAGESGMGRVLERWLGNRACKTSLKAGCSLNNDEQQQLLRQMEQTPHIAQCNHGRPTYVRLSLDELDRLFGRRG